MTSAIDSYICQDEHEACISMSPKALAHMSAQDVTDTIAEFAEIRAQLKPAVPEHFPQGGMVHRIDRGSAYACGTDAMTGLPSLALRHGGIGWFNFLLDRVAALQISNLLKRNVEHPVQIGTKQ